MAEVVGEDKIPNRKARLAHSKELRQLAKHARKRVEILEKRERAAAKKAPFKIARFETVG